MFEGVSETVSQSLAGDGIREVGVGEGVEPGVFCAGSFWCVLIGHMSDLGLTKSTNPDLPWCISGTILDFGEGRSA